MSGRFHVPQGGPPESMPNPEIFARMGEANIRRLLADVYERLARSPIAEMFPSDAGARYEASQKSADFFVFAMGGPDRFRELHGEPFMRRRHLRFRIGPAERDAWLACFLDALENAPEDYRFPVEHLEGFKEYLRVFSNWMINSEN